MSAPGRSLAHRGVRMGGRDPDERHRAATPLELLFDLAFVVAFGNAADELAHYLGDGHARTALLGFAFAAFAVSWAWINFSWFASAYDTDDWVFRLMTLLQMAGVLVFALGIAQMFSSIAHHEGFNARVMVAGYVVMRVAMVAQWSRVAVQHPERRATAVVYIRTIVLAQAGWVALAVARPHIGWALVWAAILIGVELAGPLLAELRAGATPWHPHHIAERYGLLVIVALGEAILGTIAALGAVVGPDGDGWSVTAAVVGIAGATLTFGMWWIYFVVPGGEILAVRRDRAFGWGYGHIVIFAAVVASGAGLHVTATFIDGDSTLTTVEALLATAVPLTAYALGIFVLYSYLTGTVDPLHWLLAALSLAVVAAALVMGAAGIGVAWCLLVLSLMPWVTVVGYELAGHRHNERVLAGLDAQRS